TSQSPPQNLAKRLSEAEATIEALLSGQIDAVFDSKSKTPVLLAQAQEALRSSEEQYRQIVEATTDGILKIDAVARIAFVNRRFAEMLGYRSTDMIGTSVFGFMSDAAKAMAADSLQKQWRGEKDPFDTTFRHKDGTDISVNIAGSPLVDASGQHVGNL